MSAVRPVREGRLNGLRARCIALVYTVRVPDPAPWRGTRHGPTDMNRRQQAERYLRRRAHALRLDVRKTAEELRTERTERAQAREDARMAAAILEKRP